jgi:hypothetical protein
LDFLIYFFPFLIFLGIVGLTVTGISWFVEMVNKYIFGCSGFSSLGTGLMDMARNIISVLIYYFLKDAKISIPIIYLVTLLPIRIYTILKLIPILIHSFFAQELVF